MLYALLATKNSISAIERSKSKSWWKKLLLTHHYFFDTTKHILLNNLEPLNLLKINQSRIMSSINVSKTTISRIRNQLDKKGIKEFVIFHPSAQYDYKIYPDFEHSIGFSQRGCRLKCKFCVVSCCIRKEGKREREEGDKTSVIRFILILTKLLLLLQLL